ncbi:hypothetical protein MMC17_001431 [Xylographa soralifera]|nr:hypothetical protein [Xylographa soralifera]
MAITNSINPPYVAHPPLAREQDTVLPIRDPFSLTNPYPFSTRANRSPSQGIVPSPLIRQRPSTSPSPPPKRRVTTPNACTTCKRAKAKCSGSQPTCTRCARRGEASTCHYGADIRSQKEAMMEEIRELRQRYSRADLILQAVGGEEGEGTVIALQRGDSYEDIERGLRVEERVGRRALPDRQREAVSVEHAAVVDA